MKKLLLASSALFLAGAAHAQTATNAPFYSNEAGIPKPAQGIVLIGVDSGSGLPCIIGTASTCTLPVGTGSGILSSNVAQFGGVNISTGTGLGGAGIPRVTVSSDSFPATQAVTGTFFQATQPVSGTFWQTTQPVSLASLPALPAGSAIIGNVRIDQTTPGTTNGVQINAALPAGTNVIGHVITDSGSVENSTLQAGSAIAGKFGIDQTTPGTTNGVQVNAALPAGANLLGKFGIDQTTNGNTNNVTVDGVGDNATCVGTASSAATMTWTGPAGVCNGLSYIQTTGYGSLSVQVVGNASNNTMQLKGSNDQGTTLSVIDTRASNGLTSAASPSFNTATVTYYPSGAPPLMDRVLVNISSYSGGSSTVNVTLKRAAPPVGDTIVGNAAVAPVPVVLDANSAAASASTGIAPVAGTAVASSLAKASASLVYRWHITTGASAGYVMTFNATSAPADGAVTPAECYPVAANAGLSVSEGDFPAYYSTGFTIVFSTTGCFTKTASATAFMSYQAK